MTEKKFKIILEIIIIVVAMTWYITTTTIPEIKTQFGSSDKFINTKDYINMIEFNINDKVNFAIIINKSNKISNILFFENNSLCLYNKDIENQNIDDGINEIVKILIKNDYLKQTSVITLTRYKETNYIKVKNTLIKKLNYFNISNPINENKNTIKNKAISLKIEKKDNELDYIRELDLYSKNITKEKAEGTDNDSVKLTKTTSKEYADNIYKELTKYISDNNIINQSVEQTKIPIHLIPAEKSGKFYPTNNSWYYVQNGKIYAYIEFKETNIYNYCYNGSIDTYIKGECK